MLVRWIDDELRLRMVRVWCRTGYISRPFRWEAGSLESLTRLHIICDGYIYDMCVKDPLASRHHVVFAISGSWVDVCDWGGVNKCRGSANGTIVNGVKVERCGCTRLDTGVVLIGSTVIDVHLGSVEPGVILSTAPYASRAKLHELLIGYRVYVYPWLSGRMLVYAVREVPYGKPREYAVRALALQRLCSLVGCREHEVLEALYATACSMLRLEGRACDVYSMRVYAEKIQSVIAS